MQRNAEQIYLDRLLVRAAVAKISLEKILTDNERAELIDIQKKITPDTKKDKILGLDSIIKSLEKKLVSVENSARIKQNFMREGALSQHDALRLIHPQDPKLVLPVIVKIIEDLLDKVKKRSFPARMTVAFLEAALAKVKEVDEKQNGNIIQLGILLFDLKKEKIRADMLPLIQKVDDITVADAEVSNWFEAILWIEGHFRREHEKALMIGMSDPKAREYGNGKLVFHDYPEMVDVIDSDDSKVKLTAGTTKHFINSHFHAMAVLIERKVKAALKLNFNSLDVFPTKIVAESSIQDVVTVSTPIEVEKIEVPIEKVSMPVIPSSSNTPKASQYKLSKTKDGTQQRLTVYLAADCLPERIDSAMRLFYKEINQDPSLELSVLQPARNNELLAKLKRFVKQPACEVFSLLKDALGECKFTIKEDSIVHNYVPTMQVYVNDNYLNSKTAASGLWPAMPYKDRGLKPLVEELFDKIKAVDEMGKRKSALEVVTYIESAWSASYGKLKVVLESLIVNLCNHMITNMDNEFEVKRSPRIGFGGSKQ